MTGPATVLLRGGHVTGTAGATAMLTEGSLVAWVGQDDSAPPAAEVVDLEGAVVAPAFVDAHVHATHTGLALDGLDLTGAMSLPDALDRLSTYARAHAGSVVIGTGWDDTRWPERRPPTSGELDRAAGGRPVYLSRVDVHSAVASSALLSAAPQAAAEIGFGSNGFVALAAHHVIRKAAYDSVDPAMRASAQRSTRRRAVELGIGAFHEMGGPDIAGEADFVSVLRIAGDEPGPDVFGYWGELGAIDRARELGAVGAGGDLFVDGSVGSHTCWLSQPYADADTRGHCWITAAQIGEHVVACARSRMQTGFHAIGDAALHAVLVGFQTATDVVGSYAIGKGRHRIEHAELVDDPASFARHGLIASVQPAFDARWGGAAGMYVDRLGPDRAKRMNPLSGFAAAGVPLVFGSDAPVTPLDPWGTLRAAVRHRTPGFGVTYRQAFEAHTVHGWRAVHVDHAGMLLPGQPASYAVWQATALDADTGLPDLDAPDPVCLRTVIRGETVFAREGALA
ncbi:MAG: amidohydrolase [Actinomycetes bacterium]